MIVDNSLLTVLCDGQCKIVLLHFVTYTGSIYMPNSRQLFNKVTSILVTNWINHSYIGHVLFRPQTS